jgi:hypothetical protein
MWDLKGWDLKGFKAEKGACCCIMDLGARDDWGKFGGAWETPMREFIWLLGCPSAGTILSNKNFWRMFSIRSSVSAICLIKKQEKFKHEI